MLFFLYWYFSVGREGNWNHWYLIVIWSILWGHLYAALEHADCISFLNHPCITLNSLPLVFPSGSFLVAKLYFAAQIAFFH